MGKRVLVIALLAALALFAYVGYSSYDTRRAGVTGQVFSSDSSRSGSKNESRGPASTGSSTAAVVSAADRAAGPPQEIETIVYPSAAAAHAMQAPANSGGTAQVTQTQQAAPATSPGGDTISPNPPNGMAFSGSGRYQLYRQGNITWRLDTETGRSCIVFATDEEWRKPRVYKAGCGRT